MSQTVRNIVTDLSWAISRLNFRIWQLASWLSLSEPKIEARMKFYNTGTIDGLTDDAATAAAGQRQIVKGIYDILGILDSKASSLMRYNGIILAVVSLLVRMGSEHRIYGLDLAILLITLFSIMLCLLVAGIFWRFLELAFPASGEMAIDKEIEQLKLVLHFRETSYQLAWLLAFVVTVLLAIRFIWHS